MSVIKKETIDVRRIGSALIGGDFTGNARNTNAIDIQPSRIAVTQVASGDRSIAIGNRNTASGTLSFAIGYNNLADETQSNAIGHNNNATGFNSLAIGDANTASSNYSAAIGHQNTSSGYYTTASGYGCTASGYYSNAIGYKAEARVQYTTNICGPQIIRKDDGESAGITFHSFCGVEVILMSKEVDLKAVADHTITLPANCKFWIRECGLVATEIDTLTVQPTVRYGITGNLAKHGAAAITTNITAAGKMEIETPLVPGDGETSLVGGVTIVATATTAKGRFYFSGKLIEDE